MTSSELDSSVPRAELPRRLKCCCSLPEKGNIEILKYRKTLVAFSSISVLGVGVAEDLVETGTVEEIPQFSGSSNGSETETMPKRRPPKIFRYDKIGSPSCYGLTALPFHTMPQV